MIHFYSRRRRPCAPRAAWLLALSAAAITAHAQPAAGAARPDPLDPNASIPALSYRSSFEPYRRMDDGKPISWREANDTVARIGGWRVYVREAQQAEPTPEAKTAGPAASGSAGNTTARPMPAGHTGHQRP
ncbi:MAG: hypothetical protein Q8R33_00245 [Burkholderiales bacterium]|nr:hypothetical protein [Burkholderiales bacterium]